MGSLSPEPWDGFGEDCLPGILKAERRQRLGQRLPPGYRFFGDRDRETYARFIDWMMDLGDSWFATLTFRDYVPDYVAGKMLERWTGRMAEAVHSTSGDRLKYVAAQEWQRREVVHFHLALVSHGLGDLSRKRWEARWERIGGGFARLYDADRHAAPYLAKYLNKARGGELRWGGSWRGVSAPASLDPGPVTVPGQ